MNKRGQVTLFIIIAIVIVAAILLTLFLTGGFKNSFSSSEINQVKAYIKDCFEFKTQEGILLLARQGGYNTLPQANINFLDEKTAYYWKDNQTIIPGVTTVEQELKTYLDSHASECLSMQGYALTADDCVSQVEIKDKVKVLFDCPVTVQKGAASAQIKEFNIEIEAPITKMLDVSSQVVTEYAKRPGYLCVECIDTIALNNNVTITAVPITEDIYSENHIWFLITDKNIKFDENNITWRFVAGLS